MSCIFCALSPSERFLLKGDAVMTYNHQSLLWRDVGSSSWSFKNVPWGMKTTGHNEAVEINICHKCINIQIGFQNLCLTMIASTCLGCEIAPTSIDDILFRYVIDLNDAQYKYDDVVQYQLSVQPQLASESRGIYHPFVIEPCDRLLLKKQTKNHHKTLDPQILKEQSQFINEIYKELWYCNNCMMNPPVKRVLKNILSSFLPRDLIFIVQSYLETRKVQFTCRNCALDFTKEALQDHAYCREATCPFVPIQGDINLQHQHGYVFLRLPNTFYRDPYPIFTSKFDNFASNDVGKETTDFPNLLCNTCYHKMIESGSIGLQYVPSTEPID